MKENRKKVVRWLCIILGVCIPILLAVLLLTPKLEAVKDLSKQQPNQATKDLKLPDRKEHFILAQQKAKETVAEVMQKIEEKKEELQQTDETEVTNNVSYAGDDGSYSEENGSGNSYSGGFGNTGRLTIPALGISVALNYGDNGQGIVDAYDSAFCSTFGSNVLIADHCDQSFAALTGAYPGMSATLEYPSYTTYVTCIDAREGYNNGGSIMVDGMYWQEKYPGCVVMYTCTYDWNHVFVTAWSAGNGYVAYPNTPEPTPAPSSSSFGYATPEPYEPQTLPPNDGVIILE